MQCSACGIDFEYSAQRSQCFVCKPHPKTEEILCAYAGGKTLREVGKSLKVGPSVVHGIVRQLGKMRPPPYLLKDNVIKLRQDWIDGWLLGDGYIARTGHARTARFQHHCKYEDYALHVRSNFENMGLSCGCLHRLTGNRGQRSYLFQTQAHREISEQLSRWYPEGKKQVPTDLEFSSTSLREWYLGDGTLTPAGTPIIYNYQFPKQVVQRLVQLIRKHVGSCKYRYDGKGYRISFPGDASARFFEAVGECPVSCYSYRWAAPSEALVE